MIPLLKILIGVWLIFILPFNGFNAVAFTAVMLVPPSLINRYFGFLYYMKSKDSNLCKLGITINKKQRQSTIDNSHPERIKTKLALPLFFYKEIEQSLLNWFKPFQEIQRRGTSGRKEFLRMGFIKRTEAVVLMITCLVFQAAILFSIIYLSLIYTYQN